MGKEYREEDFHKHIQELEVGDKFFTKSKVITRTEVELYSTINGDTPSPESPQNRCPGVSGNACSSISASAERGTAPGGTIKVCSSLALGRRQSE